MNDFDVNPSHSNEKFKGTLDLDVDWQIAMIVGGSGTGKTTIGRELFGDLIDDDFEYQAKSIVDDMPENVSVKEIEQTFYTVGLGSVPNWLKPYKVLSNGEKMRVDLARKILSTDFIVFDEFTSVVDRQVAKVMSLAIKKAMRKYSNKKFVAIGCHRDVIEFLQPDWIFDTDVMKQSFQLAHDQNKNLMSDVVGEKNGKNLASITI